ncbi:LacI family DNA-binding transcriptional regulator [Vibrio vulnificus]|nr:LacI family DNA-binding transcriptional regulator [Vibrio vulnificus]
MKDVAELADVSMETVSRVINRTSYVEPVMQQRVEHST